MRHNSKPHKVKLCAIEEIDDCQSRGFDPFQCGRDEVFVVRQGSKVFAWRNACPHPGYEGTSLPWRKNAYLNGGSNLIVCSGHGAQFDIVTGECLSGPCLGKALEKERVQVDDDGQLYWYSNKLQEK